jgi:predicted RNase H-like nuclease (RuvC/YqgF family)
VVYISKNQRKVKKAMNKDHEINILTNKVTELNKRVLDLNSDLKDIEYMSMLALSLSLISVVMAVFA